MEVENTGVSEVISEYPMNAWLGTDLVTTKVITWMDNISAVLLNPLSDYLCSVDRAWPSSKTPLSKQEINTLMWGEDDHSVPY